MADIQNDEKEVRFELYCYKCRHSDEPEDCEACDECLQHPTNLYSQKPVRYWPK